MGLPGPENSSRHLPHDMILSSVRATGVRFRDAFQTPGDHNQLSFAAKRDLFPKNRDRPPLLKGWLLDGIKTGMAPTRGFTAP